MIQSLLLHFARFVGSLRWVRRGIRERIIRVLHRFSAAPKDLTFQASLRGLEYEGTLSNFIDWNVYFYGVYEPDLVELFELCAAGSHRCALDIGANVGHHTLVLSRIFESVEAFEPWERVRVRLDAHLQRNGITNTRVHPIALGDSDGFAPFFAPPDQNLGQGSLIAGHNQTAESASEQVTVRNGDGFLGELSATDPDLIKIDVEGYEGQVLRGLRSAMTGARPVVIFECSDTTKAQLGSRDELLSLFPSSYELFEIHARTEVLWFFEQSGVHLIAFDFEGSSANVLALPIERKRQFSRILDTSP